MRIAIDIDSTLHHYWDVLSEAARRRFGIELPYEEQFTWGITRLKPRQLELCIAETHSDPVIAAGRPYEGAVEAVRRWHAAGHFIHVTSHRAAGCHPATAGWLESIGLPYDELYCSYDKVARCREIGIHRSMGSKGDCFDNAVAESFFATLEKDLLRRPSFARRQEARTAVFDHIDRQFDAHRVQSFQGLLRAHRIVHDRALGDFQAER